MNKRHFFMLVILASISSFLGGAFVQFFSTLTFFDKDGKSKAILFLGDSNSPEMVLYGRNGINRFNFGLAPAGNAGMTVNNGNFEKLLDVNTSSGIPAIMVRGEHASIHWTAP